MFSKVLVCVDGSDNSFRALDAALFLSEKLGAEVTAVHVMEEIPVLHIQSEKLLRKLMEDYQNELQLILSKCSEIAIKQGSNLTTKLLHGNAASAILDFCEKGEYDVIVIGSRGLGKFKELVLGSVSNKIVHLASCPVMIIR